MDTHATCAEPVQLAPVAHGLPDRDLSTLDELGLWMRRFGGEEEETARRAVSAESRERGCSDFKWRRPAA
eukprot:536107-Pleurochrysis_carterae.AAC.1